MCKLQFLQKLLCVTMKCIQAQGRHLPWFAKQTALLFNPKKSRGLGVCQMNRCKHIYYYTLDRILTVYQT